jgi:arylsulfatase A-like enzyme
MTRRGFLEALAAAPLLPAQPRVHHSQNKTPPNILFIMPDQWRGMDLGCMGNSQVRTPNIDRLASQGINFTNAVANCPLCTPARAILQTGRYPHENGMQVNDVPLPLNERGLGTILHERNYLTGFVGKWHLHGGVRMPGFVPPGPRRHGFDFWAANICNHDYFNQQYFRNNPTPIHMQTYEVPAWTDLAIEFLEKAQSGTQPFCLYVDYGPPHDPYQVPPGYEGLYHPAGIQLRPNWQPGAPVFGLAPDIVGYYSAIACLDTQIGRLLARLNDLGLAQNTIVVFTSDHGDMLGSHGTYSKRKPWEESVRVPAIMRMPEVIPAGVTSDAPFSHVDMVPTLLGLSGMRPEPQMQGFDYSSYLRGQSSTTPTFAHLMMYSQTEGGEFPPWRGIRSRKLKYARFQNKPWMLYDLEHDPYEMNNLLKSQSAPPELEHHVNWLMTTTRDSWTELHDAPYE